MEHELKTDSEVFEAVMLGVKPWEIRKNDRGYEVGDILNLRETKYTGIEMSQGKALIYTGREVKVRVMYILPGPIYDLIDGWCVMTTECI